MWWSQCTHNGAAVSFMDCCASIATIAMPTANGGDYAVAPTSYVDGARPSGGNGVMSASEGFLIWHYFDTVEGIDVLSSAAAQ
jgi:hypothetical protein